MVRIALEIGITDKKWILAPRRFIAASLKSKVGETSGWRNRVAVEEVCWTMTQGSLALLRQSSFAKSASEDWKHFGGQATLN